MYNIPHSPYIIETMFEEGKTAFIQSKTPPFKNNFAYCPDDRGAFQTRRGIFATLIETKCINFATGKLLLEQFFFAALHGNISVTVIETGAF